MGPTWKSSFLSFFVLVAWLWEGCVLASPNPPDEEEPEPREAFFLLLWEGGREGGREGGKEGRRR
jgi:hypothetical protein